MNALPALALREESAQPVVRTKLLRRKKRKLLKLVPKQKVRPSTLNLEEQSAMVLEFREKGRSLAHSILRKWHSRLDPQEVESIVDLSLCEAVKRFDRRKGASFVTFLFYHLRGNLIRAVSAAATLNFVPLPDLDQVENPLEGTGRAKVLDAMEMNDQLCHHEYESPDDNLLKKELAKISDNACSKLDPLEREVIYRIYVLEQQLMDIARSLGYSRCHISRVKRKALETLHSDLSPLIHPDGKAPKPNFGDSDEESDSTLRRVVHRRKPRSKKIFEQRPELREEGIYNRE